MILHGAFVNATYRDQILLGAESLADVKPEAHPEI